MLVSWHRTGSGAPPSPPSAASATDAQRPTDWREAGEPRTGSLVNGLAIALSVLVNLNVLLGLFNLIPIPPFDGAGIVEGLFPNSLGKVYDKMREVPILQFVGLLLAWNIFPVLAVLRSATYLVHSG